jgi:hypothetical protein
MGGGGIRIGRGTLPDLAARIGKEVTCFHPRPIYAHPLFLLVCSAFGTVIEKCLSERVAACGGDHVQMIQD